MRRWKIRATPNLGAGVGPRSTQANSTPSSTTPLSKVSSPTGLPSTVPASNTPVNKQSQESTVDSSVVEKPPSNVHIGNLHKPDLIVLDNIMKDVEENSESLDVMPHKLTKMVDVALISEPSSSQIDLSSENILGLPSDSLLEDHDLSSQNIVGLPSDSLYEDDTLQNGLVLQDDASSRSQTSLLSISSPSITSLQNSQVLTSSPPHTSLVSVSSSPTSSISPLHSNGAAPLMSPAMKHTLMPPCDTLIKCESVETSPDLEKKPSVSIRRKKIKVMPMVSSSRKGSVAEKHNARTMNTHIDKKFDVKIECLDIKVKSQQVSPNTVENVTCIVDEQNSKVHMQTEKGNDIEMRTVTTENKHTESKRESACNENQRPSAYLMETQSDLKGDSQTTEKSLADEILNMNVVAKNEALILMDENETYGAEVERRTLEFNDNNQSSSVSNMDSSSAVANVGCKRRSKIRAKPMLLAKRKISKKGDDTQEENFEKINPGDNVVQSGLEKFKTQENCNVANSVEHEGFKMKTDSDSFRRMELNKSIKIEDNHTQKLYEIDEGATDKSPKKVDVVEKKVCNPLGSRLQRTNNDKLKIMREDPEGVEVVDNNSITDDSYGDKENSSRLISSSQSIKKEFLIKEKGKSSSQQKVKAKSSPVVFTAKNALIKTEKKVKLSLKRDDGFSTDGTEEKTEKQIFRERKKIYRNKISRGVLERSNMTMFDLIFWNPSSNPMPGRTETSRKRVRLSSKCETESIASDVIEEQRVDDLGLDVSGMAPEASPSTPDEVQVCQESSETPKPSDIKAKEEASTTEDVLAPRVKIGPNGQIILDEQSIKIQTTAAKNRDEILSKAEVVEECNDSAHYGKWSKKRHRSNEWTIRETARFYRALSTVGTDFSLMEALITWRSRAELKTKFKKEEKINQELVDRALKDCTQFDFSLFEDESDYDPEEDRRAARMAERDEARRKRLEMKQSEREQEQGEKELEKKEEKARLKKRKTVLRKQYKQRKRKGCDSNNSSKESLCMESEEVSQSDTEQMSVVPKPPESSRKTVKKANIKPTKKRQLERRNSLVISEVTVTMETVNSEKPKQPSDEYIIERTIAENLDSDMEISKPYPFRTSHVDGALPEIENTQKMWHFPVSAIQTLDDGRQTILVPTPDGEKSVPVPVLPPGTSNVVVVATGAPDSPGEHIYHVYVVSPLESSS
ncbi:uncharacterized protein Bdp1 [Panulirus ornatus]|uniref:uncharacterized protein Bdp1 n=1 Tax=Panulirus ornatus TaxID=150431 RepID=UPI003A8860C7